MIASHPSALSAAATAIEGSVTMPACSSCESKELAYSYHGESKIKNTGLVVGTMRGHHGRKDDEKNSVDYTANNEFFPIVVFTILFKTLFIHVLKVSCLSF